MKIAVKRNNSLLSLEEALSLNYVIIRGLSIIVTDSSCILCPYTNLVDIKGREIYENARLKDKSGIKYKVVKYYASVYLQKEGSNTGCLVDTLTNYKSGNLIDFELCDETD